MSPPPPLPRHDFSGRVVLVAGAAGGIGGAVADAFAAAGATLSRWDLPGRARGEDSVAVDLCDPASVAAALAATLDRHGRLDIVVNSAGYAGPTMPVERYDPAEWLRVIDTNLTAAFHLCRAVIPPLRRAGWGRIVTIASLAGKEGTPDAAAYSAAKAGVIALTKALGKELAGSGILVNAIAPAAIDTPLLGQMTPDHVRTMIAKSPLGRLGRAEEVAALTLFLASEACSFSTGAVFDLSGGRATY